MRASACSIWSIFAYDDRSRPASGEKVGPLQEKKIDLERGASMVETALIIALVALMGTASLRTVANGIKAPVCIADQTLAGATNGNGEGPCDNSDPF